MLKNMRKIIGLTGGIASGKSTVAHLFIDEGVYVIDSDQLAKDIQTRPAVIKQTAALFGAEIIINGELDRVKLAKIVFSDAQKREQLNALIHPLIRQEIETLLAMRKNKLVIIDMPLLYEAGFDDMVEEVIVVYATRAQQIERLMARNNLTEAEAIERIDAQMPLDEKVKRADFVLDNTGTKHELYLQFKVLYNSLNAKLAKGE